MGWEERKVCVSGWCGRNQCEVSMNRLLNKHVTRYPTPSWRLLRFHIIQCQIAHSTLTQTALLPPSSQNQSFINGPFLYCPISYYSSRVISYISVWNRTTRFADGREIDWDVVGHDTPYPTFVTVFTFDSIKVIILSDHVTTMLIIYYRKQHVFSRNMHKAQTKWYDIIY